VSKPVRHARSSWDELITQATAETTAHSTAASENADFRDLGLPKTIVTALHRHGIEQPFPIQAATIPSALSGRDVLGRAATGSGKTLAFGLPLIARLAGGASAPRRPRGLVLVPTRELAMQVSDTLAPIAHACGITVRLVAGGLSLPKQVSALQRGVDIVVATPGRLTDLIDRKACALSDVEVAVLDEADHMADLGFLPAVRALLDLTPPNGQRLLFSATLDGAVGTLVDNYLHDPAMHALAPTTSPVTNMSHYLLKVRPDAKADLVTHIAARDGRTILFVRTKHGAERLAGNLTKVGVRATALHGGRTQSQRNRALDAFRDGRVTALVATDVAARGIHVDDVSLVLHVDPPEDPKDYLHRSGRTARAGNAGVVVVLATAQQERGVRRMLTSAAVRAETLNLGPADSELAAITGARTPAGAPTGDPAQAATERPAEATHRERRSVGSDKHGQTRGYRQSRDNREPRGHGRPGSRRHDESRGHNQSRGRGHARTAAPSRSRHA
jgi:superfamily II DNA/RNA helicase